MVEKGIHPGLGMAEYHDWKLDKAKLIEGPISCSMLKEFDVNPYAWLKGPERKETPALRTGSLFDAAVTDPDEVKKLLPPPADLEPYIVSPFDSFRTKEAREWKKEQEEKGMRILKESDAIKEREDRDHARKEWKKQILFLERARDEVYAHPIAGKILDGAGFQVGVVGEVGEIPAKCLLDILPSPDGDYCETGVDYKTISTGLDDESIRKAIGRFKYHWQAAFYRTLFNKVSPDRLIENFCFIFQDVNTLEVRVIELDDDALALGTRAVGEAVKNFVTCAHRGIKSRYLNKSTTLDLMPYHAMNEEENLQRKELGV